MLFRIPQKIIPILTFDFNGVHIQQVNDCNLNWKAHLHMVSTKISRVIGLLRNLKYMFPSYILHTIYNYFILPYFNYSLLAWGTKCEKIELLQKKAVSVVHSKSPIAHTNLLFRKINHLRVSDLYTCNLLTRCTRGDASSFFLYLQNVFVCIKQNSYEYIQILF